MQDISTKIMTEIKDKKIVPISHWRFVVKDGLIWFLVCLSLVFGSFACAVTLFIFEQHEWDLYSKVDGSLIKFFFFSLPYFWMILLLVVLGLVYYNFKHTKIGYRFRFALVLLVSIIASVVLGFIFYKVGFGEALEKLFAKTVPYYRQFIYDPESNWFHPDDGFLSGMIIEINQYPEFELQDRLGNFWLIESGQATIKKPNLINEGQKIKIRGNKIGDFIFNAKEIRPLQKGCNCFIEK